jgi:hypothetical protein
VLGERPYSPWKIALAVLAVLACLFFMALIALIFGNQGGY